MLAHNSNMSICYTELPDNRHTRHLDTFPLKFIAANFMLDGSNTSIIILLLCKLFNVA